MNRSINKIELKNKQTNEVINHKERQKNNQKSMVHLQQYQLSTGRRLWQSHERLVVGICCKRVQMAETTQVFLWHIKASSAKPINSVST